MTPYIIIFSIGLALFLAYNAGIVLKFGWPKSLSQSYYLLEDLHKGFGWFFTGFMFTSSILLMIPWIQVTESFGPWRQYLTFLTFISAGALAFVGAAPKFVEEAEGKVHTISATTAAVTALLWDFVVCYNLCYVTVIFAALVFFIGWKWGNFKECKVYWLEMMAFIPTFMTIYAAFIYNWH